MGSLPSGFLGFGQQRAFGLAVGAPTYVWAGLQGDGGEQCGGGGYLFSLYPHHSCAGGCADGREAPDLLGVPRTPPILFAKCPSIKHCLMMLVLITLAVSCQILTTHGGQCAFLAVCSGLSSHAACTQTSEELGLLQQTQTGALLGCPGSPWRPLWPRSLGTGISEYQSGSEMSSGLRPPSAFMGWSSFHRDWE